MMDYSGTMNVLGFNEVVYMCHPPDQTDAQDCRGSLDRHLHHVAALTYSMNTLLQMRMISVSHPIVYIDGMGNGCAKTFGDRCGWSGQERWHQ